MIDKPINLSWLVEKWTLPDEDSYLKCIWINVESLDIIRINQGETEEDIIANYIDIDKDVEDYILMPGRDAFDTAKCQAAFLETLDRHDRDQFIEEIDGFSPNEEFMDTVFSLGLENKFNAFKEKLAANILLSRASDEGIAVNKDMETINIDKL